MNEIPPETKKLLMEVKRQFELLRPLKKQIEENLKTLHAPLTEAYRFIQENREPVLEIIQQFRREVLPYAELFQQMATHNAIEKSLEKAGWLPHYSTPIDTVLGGSDNLRDGLDKYYEENWVDIRISLEERVCSFDINEETKSVFLEALEAHERKMYRSVSRLLFPEIERLSRLELETEEDYFKGLASQEHLRDLVGSMPFLKEPHAMYLYSKLADHLYARVKNFEELEKVKADSLPNRHATLHGLVSYPSMQNSLNTIFMAEYIFQLIDLMKLENVIVPAA